MPLLQPSHRAAWLQVLLLSIITIVGSLLVESVPFTTAFQPVQVSYSRDELRRLKIFSHPNTQSKTSGSLLNAVVGDKNSNNKAKGVYVRPSGAIERGSGFFVPGLEGPRVRVLFGTVLLGLTVLNHSLVVSTTTATTITGTSFSNLSLEEVVAVVYSLLVLFQAAIEYGKEELIVEGGSSKGKNGSSSIPPRDLVQQWNAAVRQEWTVEDKDKIQWAAASYLSVTPATQILLLTKDDQILYRLGSDSSMTGERMEEGVEAALNQLRQSKGGRVALPNTHPAVVALGLGQARTVVLQRITEDSCWVVSSSDQLLASFTPADLKWLGQLANYVKL